MAMIEVAKIVPDKMMKVVDVLCMNGISCTTANSEDGLVSVKVDADRVSEAGLLVARHTEDKDTKAVKMFTSMIDATTTYAEIVALSLEIGPCYRMMPESYASIVAERLLVKMNALEPR